jgi:hypothetical protein
MTSTQQVLDDLTLATMSGKTVFMVGSAISMAAPTYALGAQQVVNCVLEALSEGAGIQDEDIAKARASQFEGLFSRLFRSIGKEAALAAIDLVAPEKLGEPHLPNQIHVALAQYALRHSQPLLTTNYDDFIERGGEIHIALEPHTFAEVGGALKTGVRRPALLKLHGDVWDPDSQTVAVEQVSRVVSPALRDAVLAALDGQVLCAIGYSGLDIDIYPLLLEANWEAAYWLARPTGDKLLEQRLQTLFKVARIRGKSAQIVPLDLFSEDMLRLLGSSRSASPHDPTLHSAYQERCTQNLRSRWRGICSARRCGAFALILENCGHEQEALRYIEGAADNLHGLHLISAEASGYHAGGHFKRMASMMRRRVESLQSATPALAAAQARLSSTIGESYRMCMGQPSISLVVSFWPYFLMANALCLHYLRAGRPLSRSHGSIQDELATYWADTDLEMWIRQLTVRLRIISVVPKSLGFVLDLMPALRSERVEQELAEVREIAADVGLRDHVLNAGKYLRRLYRRLGIEVPDDPTVIAEQAALEYGILKRPLGNVLASFDVGQQAMRHGDYEAAREAFRAGVDLRWIDEYPGGAGRLLMELGRCYTRLQHRPRASRAFGLAAATLWRIDGFGNKLQAVHACLMSVLARLLGGRH